MAHLCPKVKHDPISSSEIEWPLQNDGSLCTVVKILDCKLNGSGIWMSGYWISTLY
jgi:hypothetical protein